jgi:hypothetical protein
VPRLRVPDDELDINSLEEAEYDDRDFDYEDYDGELPPNGTFLDGYVKKAWWCYTSNEDPMIKLIFIADGNTGAEEEFNGLPIWEQLALTNTAKFKWKPFIDLFGIRLIDIKKKTVVAEDADSIGDPIEKIGTWEPGDDARCRVLTKRGRWNGKPKVEVKRWLEAEDTPDDDDEELEDYEEEEEEPPPPPRRSRPAAGGAKGAAAKSSAKPAAAKTSSTRRTAQPAPARRTAKAPARGRRQSAQAGYSEEPPF